MKKYLFIILTVLYISFVPVYCFAADDKEELMKQRTPEITAVEEHAPINTKLVLLPLGLFVLGYGIVYIIKSKNNRCNNG